MTKDHAALATALRKRAKAARDFVEYAEANRDDWFSTMPPEVSADKLQEAELLERAAKALEDRQ